MPLDLSKVSDDELKALQSNDFSKLSDGTLRLLQSQNNPNYNPHQTATNQNGVQQFLSGMVDKAEKGYNELDQATGQHDAEAKLYIKRAQDEHQLPDTSLPPIMPGAGVAGLLGKVAEMGSSLIPGSKIVRGIKMASKLSELLGKEEAGASEAAPVISKTLNKVTNKGWDFPVQKK